LFGWPACVHIDEKFGGSQIPKTVYAAADFIVGTAHNGYEMFTGLSVGAARLIVSFGSDELISTYAANILSGKWAATMCLTEPQAGALFRRSELLPDLSQMDLIR
jgi:butyryl-CoA dehydrogenase